MKKNLMTLAAVLCCTALFTSCGKNNPDQPEAPDTTPVSAVMTYKFTVTEDLFNAFTLTVEYYDAAGARQAQPRHGLNIVRKADGKVVKQWIH